MKEAVVNKWIRDAYAINTANGFHDPEHPHTNECRLMLIVTEISEAVEADRKGRVLDKKAFELFDFLDKDFADQRYWEQRGFANMFSNTVKDTKEDELADIVIRCCDFLGCIHEKYAFVPDHYPNGFYDTFADKGWDWSQILFDVSRPVVERVRILIDDVCWYCENNGIDIAKHVEWKLRYNKTRPFRHGKTY